MTDCMTGMKLTGMGPGEARQGKAGRQAGVGPDLRNVLVGLPQGSGVPNGVGSAEGPADAYAGSAAGWG
jgi:hypothetical protein